VRQQQSRNHPLSSRFFLSVNEFPEKGEEMMVGTWAWLAAIPLHAGLASFNRSLIECVCEAAQCS
jgi:hypothetical protein